MMQETIAGILRQKYPHTIVDPYTEGETTYMHFRNGVYGWLDNTRVILTKDKSRDMIYIPYSDPDFFNKLHFTVHNRKWTKPKSRSSS